MRDKALFYNALGDLHAQKGEYEQGESLLLQSVGTIYLQSE